MKNLPGFFSGCCSSLRLLGLVWIVVFTARIASFAQGVTVSGLITGGTASEPLPGVNVVIKGTQKGATTDGSGRYSITNVPPKAVLVASFIGYVTTEEPLNGRNTVNLNLTLDAANLQEVVVVGYGTQKKINITGAVDQIAGKDLEARPIANVMQGLQGVSPGLNITYQGGQPGTVPNINIRGFTSINGGGPLIVIDGIPSSNNEDLLRLNPSDIASFSVLRDAATASIYGARAAFGVVLITTKQGGQGRQSIIYNNYFSWGRPTVLPQPVTDPYIYSRVLETSTDNTPWDYVNYSDEHYRWAKERSENPTIEDVRLNPADPTKWAYLGSNNWYDYFFNKSSLSQNHSVSFNGSATANNMPIGYYVSADYTKENGLNKIADDFWNRYSLRARVNFSPLKWLKIDNNLTIYQTKRASPSVNITDIYYLQPTDVAVNPDGSWANTGAGRLAARLTDGGNNQEDMFGFQNISRMVATFLNGDLQVTGDASFKREQWKYHRDYRKFSIGFGPGDIRQEGTGSYANGAVIERNGTLTNTVYNLYANYSKTLGKHTITALAGYNQEGYVYSTVESEKNVLISSSLPHIGLTTGDAFIRPSYNSYATRSLFGRLNYTLKERYILEANGRYDGSSRFPSNNRWGFFPSISAAWVASAEPFLNGMLPYVPTLKLRASYGDLGNQSVGYFNYLQTLPTALSSYLINGSQQTVITGAPSLRIDPRNYTWERVSTMNFGADVGLFKEKVLISFDYYIRNTRGMLTAGQELPGVLGTSVPSQNAADLRTNGWELTLNYRDSYVVGAKPLTLDAKFILSDSRSVITKFRNDQQLFSTYREGQQLGEIWGLVNDGMFANEDEIKKLDQSAIVPWGALSVVPGWPRYKDLNGDGKIEKGFSQKDPKDLQVIGNTTARYRLGLNLSASWNGFDATVFLQGVGKADYYPQHYLFWGPYQQPYANIYPWNLDFYRGTSEPEADRAKHSASYIQAGLADANTDAEYPVLQSWLADNNYQGGGAAGLDIPQTRYLLSAAYVRVKNVTIGYTLPAVLTRRIKVNRVRVFASGENLFEFSKLKKYVDPESVNDGYGWAYPFQRKMAVGLNFEL
ncbi:SusC/RagA family TonB-linked outer membrane protein [Larkinella arboricola]